MVETTLFVPCTRGGKLAKRIQKADDNFICNRSLGRLKVVEEKGQTLESILRKKNPWAKGTECGRDRCWPCSNPDKKEKGKCTWEGVVYQITCNICKDLEIEAIYYGETARTGFHRGEDHSKAIKGGDKENAMYKHNQIHHNGEEATYTMKIIKRYRSAMARQIGE